MSIKHPKRTRPVAEVVDGWVHEQALRGFAERDVSPSLSFAAMRGKIGATAAGRQLRWLAMHHGDQTAGAVLRDPPEGHEDGVKMLRAIVDADDR